MPTLLPVVPNGFTCGVIFSLVVDLRAVGRPRHLNGCVRAFFSGNLIAYAIVFVLTMKTAFPVFLLPRGTFSLAQRWSVCLLGGRSVFCKSFLRGCYMLWFYCVSLSITSRYHQPTISDSTCGRSPSINGSKSRTVCSFSMFISYCHVLYRLL